MKRIPRWLAWTAVKLGQMEPSTPKRTAAPSKELMKSVAEELEIEDAEIIADFNALSGETFIDENGNVQHHVTNELEATAGDRVLLSWNDLEHLTMQEHMRMGFRVKHQMVGEGYMSAFIRQEMNALQTERAMHIRPHKTHDFAMVKLAAMARSIRGMNP